MAADPVDVVVEVDPVVVDAPVVVVDAPVVVVDALVVVVDASELAVEDEPLPEAMVVRTPPPVAAGADAALTD